MAFSDYRKYTASELRKLFQVELKNNADLFDGFTPSGNDYADLQTDVTKISSRLRLSKFDNEATRGSLLVSRILWKAGEIYQLGVFFEPAVTLQQDVPLDLPHQLSGTYDGALSLDEIDFVSPIISVVEVKRSNLSEGLGQCLAEMYATLHIFKQNRIFGIITDGEVWEFFLLEGSVLSVDARNYYIISVADIVDRIGYISTLFKS
ncbi:MAG: hypothetical protein GY795_23065 [Desulfobacterales bacterium]|nr:hypothetical protein [Desulfobacterales bacterium]